MAIAVRGSDGMRFVAPNGYSNEAELENLLSLSPALLQADEEAPVAFVHSQVDLREAGSLDLLFVNADGLPIAVEVKLARNAQARREVVAQAIDYLSALTSLTVDELDARVGGRLEPALRSFSEAEAEDEFERRWQAVGANLRAGLARLVVALDEAPSDLERIVRFLARTSDLDVQLMTVQRFVDPGAGEILVPFFVVTRTSQDRVSPTSTSRKPPPELLASVDAYNAVAPDGLRAVGVSPGYRQIRPPNWPPGMRTHYEFRQTSQQLGAELHIESDAARPLAEFLRSFAGKPVARGECTLVWDQTWNSGRGRLAAQFAPSTSPQTLAEAMRDLISLTQEPVEAHLRALSGQSKAVGR